MIDDLKYAIRGFMRSKVTTAVLLVSLGLGTGANAVLYGVMNGLLFDVPGGVVRPSRLVSIFTSKYNGATNGLSSYADYLSLKAETTILQSLSASDDAAIEAVRFGSVLQRVRVAVVTDDYFTTLGVAAHAGRLFGPGDAAPSDRAPAVISLPLWIGFGSPHDIVGKSVAINDQQYTIVGIAPARFNGLQLGRQCDIWIPLSASPDEGRGVRRLQLVGRLADGAALESAQGAVAALATVLADRYPETNRGTLTDSDEARRMTVVAYSRLDPSARKQVILISVVVFGATGMLLLSACVNAGGLLLSRSAARRRELAVKIALGANRLRLVRQVMLEGVLVSLTGACLGLLLAHWTAGLLPAQLAPDEADLLDTSLDLSVVAVAVGLSCVAGLLFAIGPARHARQTVDAEVLRADAGAISARTGHGVFRTVVVVGQVALSTVLLIGAGLLVQSLSLALQGELGSGNRDIGIALLRIPGIFGGNVVRGIQFHTDVTKMAHPFADAGALGWVATLPVVRGTVQTFEFDAARPGIKERLEVEVNVASAGYFRAVRIPLIEGRLFNAEDVALAPGVVVVNDVLARRYFGPSAVGRYLQDPKGQPYRIIGVVRSGKYRTLQEAPEPMAYFSLSQQTPEYLHLVVRTQKDGGPAIREIVGKLLAIDRAVDVRLTMTFDEHLRAALKLDQVLTTVVAACGLAALMLATIGVYGVIDDGVRRRTPEIGLRLALGANRGQILRLVFSEGLRVTAAGSVVGVALAWLLARAVSVFVFGLPSIDLVSLLVAPLGLALVMIAAAVIPTRRALKVSPTIALRAEG